MNRGNMIKIKNVKIRKVKVPKFNSLLHNSNSVPWKAVSPYNSLKKYFSTNSQLTNIRILYSNIIFIVLYLLLIGIYPVDTATRYTSHAGPARRTRHLPRAALY